MSLGAELGLAALIEALRQREARPVALISEFGIGSPFAAQVPGVQRMALRPSGGVHLSPVVRYDPAIDIGHDARDARRIAGHGLFVVDAVADGLNALLRAARRIGVDRMAALRLRGGTQMPLPDMRPVLRDERSGDVLYLHEEFDLVSLGDRLAAIASGECDEFDLLAGMRGTDICADLRFVALGAEVVLHPVCALDLPHVEQLDAALGERRAVIDPALTMALTVPQFSARPAPFGLSITGLAPGAGDPSLIGVTPDDWQINAVRHGPEWTCRITPARIREAEFLELSCPHGGVELTDIWTGAVRRRAAWEDWDEAGAQLDLEQRW
ncbi:MAG: hypothetical protein AAF367_12280 [Pseudomonadota bacterium]